MSTNPESPEVTIGQVWGHYGSGTNFLDSSLRRNVLGLSMLPDFDDEGNVLAFGWKHADVGSPLVIYDEEDRLLPGKLLPVDEFAANALFVVLTRNPFDWIRAFNGKPHHAPAHWGMDLDEFVRSRWEAFALPRGSEIFTRENAQNYLPLVEDAEKVEDFPSPLHLRADRNNIYASFQERFPNVVYAHYKPLADTEDSHEAHIRAIADVYGLKMTKDFDPVRGYKGSSKPHAPTQYCPIPPETLSYIIDTMDWDAERQLGYELVDDAANQLDEPETWERPEGLVKLTEPSPRCYKLGELCTSGAIEPTASIEPRDS